LIAVGSRFVVALLSVVAAVDYYFAQELWAIAVAVVVVVVAVAVAAAVAAGAVALVLANGRPPR